MLRAFLFSCYLAIATAVSASAASDPANAAAATSQTSESSLAKPTSTRESELAKAVEKQERRHFDLHRFYIPLTQGNLQWLAATVGARPEEAALVWKLMRGWDGARWTSMAARNPS